MEQGKNIGVSSVVVMIAFGIFGCASPAPRAAPVNHIVIFDLAQGERAPQLIADCEVLRSIQGVRSYFAGSHLDTGRESVETNYDVALYVGFESEDAYRAYLDDPIHDELVERWSPHLRGYKVYDVSDPEP